MGRDRKYGVVSVSRHAAIPNDEPVFILRAKDVAAPAAIECYAEHAAKAGAKEDFIKECLAAYEDFCSWQETHTDLIKVPD
jgi:hypothetical protein